MCVYICTGRRFCQVTCFIPVSLEMYFHCVHINTTITEKPCILNLFQLVIDTYSNDHTIKKRNISKAFAMENKHIHVLSK